MTAADVIRIVSTVAITQAVCDLLANKFIFSTENYSRVVSALDRARIRRDKAVASAPPAPTSNASKSSIKAIEKHAKKVQRADEDYGTAASNVARKHSGPQVVTSIVFIILYRILNIEYQGKIVAVLPYEPWGLIRRFSMRGLNFEPDFILSSMAGVEDAADVAAGRVTSVNQACGFLFIYLLSTMSVKFIVNKALGKKAPPGADKGFLTYVDDPRGQRLLRELGVDTDEIDAIRKNL